LPAFLEDFVHLINGKRDYLRERVLKGKFNPLEDEFKKHMAAHWVPLNDLSSFSADISSLNVMAVDSSVYSSLLSSGGILYISRGMAMYRGIVSKKMDVEVIFSREKMSSVNDFITAKMELLEFEVALEALKNGFDGDAILIDGSLYGRASHLPIEPRVDDQRDALLHYFRVYKNLLDFCHKSNVLLLGISKESRSTFYRDYLLHIIFNEKIRMLDVEEEDKELLGEIFFQVLDSERIAFERFYRLKKKYGVKLETIDVILQELASPRPDYQLIARCAPSIGYTRPLLLGPSIRMAKRLREYIKNPEEFVRKYFPRLSAERGDDFIQWASNVFKDILNFPSFVSFYVLLDLRDSPIRIDMPYYDKTLFEVGWPEPTGADIECALKIVVTGYCGLNAYNIWLKSVDEKVRLRRKVADEIYLPYLEKMFGEKIIRGRGYRRVKYP